MKCKYLFIDRVGADHLPCPSLSCLFHQMKTGSILISFSNAFVHNCIKNNKFPLSASPGKVLYIFVCVSVCISKGAERPEILLAALLSG